MSQVRLSVFKEEEMERMERTYRNDVADNESISVDRRCSLPCMCWDREVQQIAYADESDSEC